jgi:hypothetical protein
VSVSEELSRDNFSAQLQSAFRVWVAQDVSCEIVLIALRDGRSSARQEQFALTFRGPRDPYVGQGTFPLTHPVMGSFDLFLVPVAQDAEGFLYEAVFNRLKPE